MSDYMALRVYVARHHSRTLRRIPPRLWLYADQDAHALHLLCTAHNRPVPVAPLDLPPTARLPTGPTP